MHVQNWPFSKVRTTDALARMLVQWNAHWNTSAIPSPDEIEALVRLKKVEDFEEYEDEEKDIPHILLEALGKQCTPSTRFVSRAYCEDAVWKVEIDCEERECLKENGYSACEPHAIEIHAPGVFVQAIALPMVPCMH